MSDGDVLRCPLCGGPNGCALAEDDRSTLCWCMRTTVDAAALARVPPASREACICATCASASR